MESSNHSLAGAGLPLLSGNPIGPSIEENSCRRCDKEFSLLFARSRKCGHCGYAYCTTCSDYQALQPRIGEGGATRGYEPANVCAYCYDMLTITASSKARLMGMSIGSLRKYLTAYNIKLPGGPIEKNELVNIIITTRETNGCLPRANEVYYRQHSVPNRTSERMSTGARARNLFARATGTQTQTQTTTQTSNTNTTQSRAQTQTQQGQQQHRYAPPQGPPPQTQYATRPTPPRQAPRPTPPQPASRPTPPQPASRPTPPRQQAPRPTPPQATRPTPTPPRPTPAPAPTLQALLDVSSDDIAHLSIHALKVILNTNHVNSALAVEKSELVERVVVLVNQERAERDEARRREEMEEMEERQRREDHGRRIREEQERRQQPPPSRPNPPVAQPMDIPTEPEAARATPQPEPQSPPRHHSPPPPIFTGERTGLCVICQDEDANIAIVDCGHLCLCRNCSDIVMASTRECPMCRTRIITEQRLLRIFKT